MEIKYDVEKAFIFDDFKKILKLYRQDEINKEDKMAISLFKAIANGNGKKVKCLIKRNQELLKFKMPYKYLGVEEEGKNELRWAYYTPLTYAKSLFTFYKDFQESTKKIDSIIKYISSSDENEMS